jgi:hypothetical protein
MRAETNPKKQNPGEIRPDRQGRPSGRGGLLSDAAGGGSKSRFRATKAAIHALASFSRDR